jgi:hypothetical protein
LRNSGRARACLGARARGAKVEEGRAPPRDEFQAFKTGVRMMERE